VGEAENLPPEVVLATTRVDVPVKPEEGLLDDLLRLTRVHTEAKKIAINRLA